MPDPGGMGKSLIQPKNLVKQIEAEPSESLLGPAASLGPNHLAALFPALDHLRNDLRRILQVAVHEHDSVGLGVCQPRRQGRLMAEIPR